MPHKGVTRKSANPTHVDTDVVVFPWNIKMPPRLKIPANWVMACPSATLAASVLAILPVPLPACAFAVLVWQRLKCSILSDAIKCKDIAITQNPTKH